MILEETMDKLEALNLIYKDINLTKNIVKIAISSTENFIKSQINPTINIEKIKNTFIDIVIGEYLYLMENTFSQNKIYTDDAIKTIQEGDTTLTYFEDKKKPIDNLIKYFLSKKSELDSIKCINW